MFLGAVGRVPGGLFAGPEAADIGELRQQTSLDFDELSASFDVDPFPKAPIELAYFGARSIGLLKPWYLFGQELWRPDVDSTPRWTTCFWYLMELHDPTS